MDLASTDLECSWPVVCSEVSWVAATTGENIFIRIESFMPQAILASNTNTYLQPQHTHKPRLTLPQISPG